MRYPVPDLAAGEKRPALRPGHRRVRPLDHRRVNQTPVLAVGGRAREDRGRRRGQHVALKPRICACAAWGKLDELHVAVLQIEQQPAPRLRLAPDYVALDPALRLLVRAIRIGVVEDERQLARRAQTGISATDDCSTRTRKAVSSSENSGPRAPARRRRQGRRAWL